MTHALNWRSRVFKWKSNWFFFFIKTLTLHIHETSNPPDNETPRVQFTRAHCALRRGGRKNGAIKFDKARFHISRGDKSQEGHLPGTRPTTSSFCSKSSSCDPAFSLSAASHCWSRSASPSADCCAQLFTLLFLPISCSFALLTRSRLDRHYQPAIGRPRTHSSPPMTLGLLWGLRSICERANQDCACASFTYYVTASSLTSRRVRVRLCVRISYISFTLAFRVVV